MAHLNDKKEELWASEERVEDASSQEDVNPALLDSIEETASSKVAWLITATLSLCGFLFGNARKSHSAAINTDNLSGYDTGYISSVLVSIGDALGHDLSSSEQELVTSLTSGGALVGAVFAGLSADRWGRKMPIWVACAVFVVGTVLQTAAFSIEQFAVGRFIVGLGGTLEP